MIIAAAESNAASIWAAVFAGVAAAAAITFGVLNLRRAARGPEGSPSWSLEHKDKSRYTLVQDGTAPAFDVSIEVTGGSRVDGVTEFERFEVGQRASLLITGSLGSKRARVIVSWQDRKRKRHEWDSDLP